MLIDITTLKQIGELVLTNPEIYPIDQRTINKLHRHKFSKSTWKGKTEKLKQQRARRRQNTNPESCTKPDTIDEIRNVDWRLLTRATASTQVRFDILYDTIMEIQDACQPLKTAKLKNDEA
jgi:hypothetical protein